MPTPGKGWRHVTISTLDSWLPGDPRGWRSRNHKRHSSGDYKSPPPQGEHAGLHAYVKQRAGDTIIIPVGLRQVIGNGLRNHLATDGHHVLAIAVAANYAHLLVELPIDAAKARRIIGHAKNAASRAVRKEMPGRIWAGGGDFRPVKTPGHQHRAFEYIVNHVHEGAWVWTFRGEDEDAG